MRAESVSKGHGPMLRKSERERGPADSRGMSSSLCGFLIPPKRDLLTPDRQRLPLPPYRSHDRADGGKEKKLETRVQ